jgi:peptidoglycan/xylan/chitin deacetylase (PgdA/CDA1 family)
MNASTIKRFGRQLAKAALAGVASWGAYDLLRRLRGLRIHVLAYHRVVDDVTVDGPLDPALCIRTDTFRRQMQQVRRRFRVLALDEAMKAIAGELTINSREGHGDFCAITFDDGYRDVYLRAAPILDELGLPAAVFVPSGFVGTERLLTHDRLYHGFWAAQRRGQRFGFKTPSDAVELLVAALPARALIDVARALEARFGAPRLDRGATVMTVQELRNLAEGGWEIGAHTVGHVVLTHEPPERARAELLRCRADLREWAQRPCRYFAFCNGQHSRATVELLERTGYAGAVTTFDRPNRPSGDRFRVGRKVLSEAHACGLDGRFSAPLSAAHLHDLFGALGLTHPQSGEVAS